MKRNKKQKSKKKNILMVILIVLFMLSLLFLITSIYVKNTILSSTQLNFTVNITSDIGLNVDTDKLHFGGIIPGGRSLRKMEVKSEYEGFVFVKTDDFDKIFINKQGQRVGPNTTANLEFTVVIPEGTRKEFFEKTLDIYILKKDYIWPLYFKEGSLLEIYTSRQRNPSISLNVTK